MSWQDQRIEPTFGSLETDDAVGCGKEKFLGNITEDIEEVDGWVKIAGVVDTGAEDHALAEGVGAWLPLVPTEASTQGKNFRGPGGEKIPAKGRRQLKGLTCENRWITISGEVCPVRRSLFSAVKIAAVGNDVVVGARRAYIKNLKTGHVTNLRRQGNVWMLDMWLKAPPNKLSEGFTRRGP